MARLTLKGKLRCAGLTDTGRVREHNEDSIAALSDIGLVVLADGMGGYNAGEVASGLAIKTVTSLVRDAVEREDLRIGDRVAGLSRASIILRDAIHRANKIIYQTAKTQPHCEGMGTTLVSGLFFDNKVVIAHIGDSRAYRLRDNQFSRLTADHSLLQELVDRGFYSPEEALRAGNKNYVTRALGVEPEVEVELQEFPVQAGDYYLLCSDGLSDMVQDDDMRITLTTFGTNLEAVSKHLVQMANANGGKDNISVVLAEVVESFPARDGIIDQILKRFS